MKRLIAAIVLGLLMSVRAAGQDAASKTGVGQWEVVDDKLTLWVDLVPHISVIQRRLIDSGFSTFSQVILVDPADKTEFIKISCSVKYDTWEEKYDLARLDNAPKLFVVNDFENYATNCLRIRLNEPKITQKLAESGRLLEARIVIEQMSTTQAGKIKEWLIKQQSGVIHGLFSHMLGELTLNNEIRVSIQVPAHKERKNARSYDPNELKENT